MKLKIFKENLAQVNSYLLIKKKHAILIDPGFNGKEILNYCKESEIVIDCVVLTHAHFDHIKDIELVSQEFDFVLYVSKQDKPLLFNDEFNYAKAFGSKFAISKNIVIKELLGNDKLIIFDEIFKIYNTPGHTKGSVCIGYQKNLFTGDTLFFNSIGRTDLYSGNNTDLSKSLEFIKNNFSNETIIYPGHGDSGKMKSVKEINPFL